MGLDDVLQSRKFHVLEGYWLIKFTPVIFRMWYDYKGFNYTVVTDHAGIIEGDVVQGIPDDVIDEMFTACSDAYKDGEIVGLFAEIKDNYVDDISTDRRFFENQTCVFCEDIGFLPDPDEVDTCTFCGDDGYYARDVIMYDTL